MIVSSTGFCVGREFWEFGRLWVDFIWNLALPLTPTLSRGKGWRAVPGEGCIDMTRKTSLFFISEEWWLICHANFRKSNVTYKHDIAW